MNRSYIYSNVIAFTREYTYCIQYTCNLLIVFHFNFALMAGFFFQYAHTNKRWCIYLCNQSDMRVFKIFIKQKNIEQ